MNKSKHQHLKPEIIRLRLEHRMATSAIARRLGVPIGTAQKWLVPYQLTEAERAKNLSDGIKAVVRPPARGRNLVHKLEYQRGWYKKYPERQKNWNRSRMLGLIAWYQSLKEGLKCCMCPESHPACLEFHHRDPEEKETEISTAIQNGWCRERILKEIEKCEPMCANCHKKLHWAERVHGVAQRKERLSSKESDAG